MSAPGAARLDAAEVAAYHRDGQVTPRWRLAPDELAGMRALLEALLASRADARPDFLALPHVPATDGAGLDVARAFFDFATAPALLDLVEQLIGPDIVLWASAVFCKPAGTGLEVPWHQDGQYWPIRPRATVTAWFAIDDVDAANGCMRIVPGSHRLGVLSHAKSDREDLVLDNVLDDARLDLARARDVVLAAGQVSLHHVDLVHGSPPNRSTRRRAGYAIRYMPASAHYDRGIELGGASSLAPVEFRGRPIWLVRGSDRDGRNDYRTGHTHW